MYVCLNFFLIFCIAIFCRKMMLRCSKEQSQSRCLEEEDEALTARIWSLVSNSGFRSPLPTTSSNPKSLTPSPALPRTWLPSSSRSTQSSVKKRHQWLWILTGRGGSPWPGDKWPRCIGADNWQVMSGIKFYYSNIFLPQTLTFFPGIFLIVCPIKLNN